MHGTDRSIAASIEANPSLHKRLFVVCAPPLWDVVRPYAETRRALGFEVSHCPPEQLPALKSEPPGYVLLVGHPRGGGPFELGTCAHPPPYRFMKTPFHGDHALVHGSLAASPRHAVGRLPVRDLDALRRLVERFASATPHRPHRVHFIDGDPKWAAPINFACDKLAGMCAGMTLPHGLTVARTSFNPYATATTPRLPGGERALLIYVGHGQRRALDGLQAGALPDADAVSLALFACCHSGAFDDDEGSLAETWLLADGGPHAVVAASNVSDPRLNPAFALALVRGLLHESRTAGESLLLAQRSLDDGDTPAWAGALRLFASRALREAHRGLYNLLGDPTWAPQFC